MDDQLKYILSNIRMMALEEGIESLSAKAICDKLNISEETLFEHVSDEEDLITKVLEFERSSFSEIFVEFDFDGMNAIDILMIVSKEIAGKYYDVTPAISILLKEKHPKIYQAHFQQRMDFVFMKIKINLQKGISQGMYRDDLSIELISRLYMSRLVDIHNKEIFPSEKFNFSTIFEVMFESFIRSIATPEGIKYFVKKKKTLNFDKK